MHIREADQKKQHLSMNFIESSGSYYQRSYGMSRSTVTYLMRVTDKPDERHIFSEISAD